MHPFTGIEITDKGHRVAVGLGRRRFAKSSAWRSRSSSDHYGHIGVNSCIRLARAMEKYNLAWMEDMVPWQFGELMKQITDATTMPILTGEDIYLKEDVHQADRHGRGGHDPSRPGQLGRPHRDEEDRRLRAWSTAWRWRCTSPARRSRFMANVHCAAATENFIALEHHSMDVPWWESMVHDAAASRCSTRGSRCVPNAPGLGVELNEEVVKQHLRPRPGFFAPTPEWDGSGATIGSGADEEPGILGDSDSSKEDP